MNLAEGLFQTAERAGAAPALYLGTDVVADYATFCDQAARLARALKLTPGDRVGLFMTNAPEVLIATYAVWIAGGAVVPINNKLHGREAAWILENAGASLVLTTPKHGAALAGESTVPILDVTSAAFREMCAALEPLPLTPRLPSDLAWLFYTSGTTGRPKGVAITQGMLHAMTRAYLADVDSAGPEDATLYAAPMSHGAGLYMPIFVQAGARHVCPRSGGFDETEIMALCDALGSVCMFMAPTMVRRFTDVAKAEGHRVPGLRTVVYAGGPMYLADIIEAVDWFGPKFVQIYGQGECPMGITVLPRADVADRMHPNWRARLASVGVAQSGIEVRIGDDTGQTLPSDTPGEILVRGPLVMPGYWQNPEATAKALTGGWLRTGDIGRMDADGYVTLTDRSKDLIISGGSNIYPREVEEVLLEHSSVHEVSVVGKTDADWGEIVCAFIVSAPGQPPDQAALDAHCKAQMARFKRPKVYRFVTELPKNNYGKVLKTELRARLAE